MGDEFVAWKEVLRRFAEILKNHEKRCKVLQTSRFGGSEIHKKLSLEGKLGPILALSWLVRAQVGAKMGDVTLLGGLRGTKLELKGLWERPRRRQGSPKGLRGTLTGWQGH